MKKCIISIVMAFLVLNAFSQAAKTPFTRDYYLEKSQKQKKMAWRLFGAGLGIAAIGGIVQLSNTNSNTWEFDFTGAYIAAGGGVLTLASIPCFVNAAKNKKMAIAITMDNQKILFPQESTFIFKKQAALCFKIDF